MARRDGGLSSAEKYPTKSGTGGKSTGGVVPWAAMNSSIDRRVAAAVRRADRKPRPPTAPAIAARPEVVSRVRRVQSVRTGVMWAFISVAPWCIGYRVDGALAAGWLLSVRDTGLRGLCKRMAREKV